MRINIEIEVLGTGKDDVSLITTSSSPSSTFETSGSDQDGGSAPAGAVEMDDVVEDVWFDGADWIDAGPAPEPPNVAGSDDSSAVVPEDTGGPPEL